MAVGSETGEPDSLLRVPPPTANSSTEPILLSSRYRNRPPEVGEDPIEASVPLQEPGTPKPRQHGAIGD